MKSLRWVAIILFFVLVATLSVHSLGSINQDIGRHLKLGQIIWETKNVPKTNLFSFTEPGHPFINHHWLSEVVFYLLSGLVGLKGLIIFKAALIAASFWLLYKSADKKIGAWPFLISAPLSIFVFLNRSDVRPEIFSYLFLSFFIFAILRARLFGQYRWLYALPFVQVLWSNTHIYFILGPLLLSFFLIERFLWRSDFWRSDLQKSMDFQKFSLKRLVAIFAGTASAILINPNFVKGALAPLFILKDYGYSIAENQSVFFLKDYGAMLAAINIFEISLIVLLISFIVALKNGRRKIIFEFLAALFFSVLAVKMIRNTGIYALVFTSVAALNLSAVKPAAKFSKQWVKAVFYLFLLAVFVFLAASVLNNNLRKWMQEGGKFGLEIPAGAVRGVEFIKQNKISGLMFNNFDVGSFLIWKLYPEQKVFVDGRPEAYSVEFFEKIYKPMQEDPKMWEYYSEKYKINYIFFAHTDITPWARQFLFHISQNPDWPLIYKDSSMAVFLKRTPENSALIKKFEIK